MEVHTLRRKKLPKRASEPFSNVPVAIGLVLCPTVSPCRQCASLSKSGFRIEHRKRWPTSKAKRKLRRSRIDDRGAPHLISPPRSRRRNLDDEEAEPEQHNKSNETADPIIISRREVVVALLLGTCIMCVAVASQRAASLRLASINAFFGVLREREPPEGVVSVQLARFMLTGAHNAPKADLSRLIWINVAETPRFKDRLLLVHLWRMSNVENESVFSVLDDAVSNLQPRVSNALATVSVHCAKFEYVEELQPPYLKARELMRSLSTSLIVCGTWLGQEGQATRRLVECLYAAFSLYSTLKLETSSFPLPRLQHVLLEDLPLLRFPGKVALDQEGGRLFVADSGNDRILVTTINGKFLEQIGGTPTEENRDSLVREGVLISHSNARGFRDGSFEEALFSNPQGLAFNGVKNELAVVDSGNDSLRMIDLANRSVKTVELASDNKDRREDRENKAESRNVSFSKPWDVCAHEGNYFVTLAGSETIWRLDSFGDFVPFCGVADSPGRVDVEKDHNSAKFASPTSICAMNNDLYVTDSDSSTLRQVGLIEQYVHTRIGGDSIFLGNLNAYGDRDGYGSTAKMQRPMGVCTYEEGKLLVADCYNHRIRMIDPKQQECRGFSGSGKAGLRDGSREVARFSSPSGVAHHEKLRRLFVADKDNHRIRVVDTQTGGVQTMHFYGFPDYGEVVQKALGPATAQQPVQGATQTPPSQNSKSQETKTKK